MYKENGKGSEMKKPSKTKDSSHHLQQRAPVKIIIDLVEGD